MIGREYTVPRILPLAIHEPAMMTNPPLELKFSATSRDRVTYACLGRLDLLQP